MRRIVLAAAVIFATVTNLWAQSGQLPAWNVFANPSAAPSNGRSASLTAMLDGAFCSTSGKVLQRGASVWACVTLSLPLAANHVFIGSAGAIATDQAMSGDCSIVSAGTITCTKTNNVAFATSATTDTTNATNITSGTLGAARLPGGTPSGTVNSQSVNYTLVQSDCGKTVINGSGGFLTFTIPAALTAPCDIDLFNASTTRGLALSSDPGCSSRAIIWMLQHCTISVSSGAWTVKSRPGRFRPGPSVTMNFFTDFVNGSDANGIDGLATGAAAFKSAEMCFVNAGGEIDLNTAFQTQIKCNMAAATADTQGLHTPIHALTGAQGGAAFQVIGASRAITGAVSNGGLCEITVTGGTASYTLNEIVSVYNVAGATGCNGTWKATVTNGTQLTLQGTTFGGAYTSGGTVTDGSTFNVTGVAAACYFGTVMQFTNIFFQATVNVFSPDWGCKIYLIAGNAFGGTPAGSMINPVDHSQIHTTGGIGIASGAGNAFLQTQSQGLFKADGPTTIDFVPGVNPSFSGLGFAYADTQAQGNFQNMTINLNGNTVTGPRCNASLAGLLASGSGVPNTYFPGNTVCVASSGGVVQ